MLKLQWNATQGIVLSFVHLGVRKVCMNFDMGLGQKCWCKLTNKLNLHKPNNKLVNTNWNQVVLKLIHYQPKLIWLTQPKPLWGGTIFLPIVYFTPLHDDYIEMVYIPKTSKRNSQNSKVMSLTIFWVQNFFIWILIEELPTTKL